MWNLVKGKCGLALGLACWLGAGGRASAAAASHSLRLEIHPHFGAAPLVFDAVAYTNSFGQPMSVTRLDLLLSCFALRRADGTWFTQDHGVAYLNAREGRTAFTLPGLPAGTYDRLRFEVGLPAQENHSDPSQFGPNHPLNPTVNGLHWGWQGGYIFMALEGDWQDANGGERGYSFHLATDRMLTTIELPLTLEFVGDQAVDVDLQVDQIFAVVHRLELSEESDSTHSRVGDDRAVRLRENLGRSFSVAGVQAISIPRVGAGSTNRVEMAATARPYRFRFSRFFPQPALPTDNPLTEEGVELGRRLFEDPLLSGNKKQSCASCHQAKRAFTELRPTSVGAEGQVGARNAMALFNLAWKRSFFWDGRAQTLREQVLQPIQNPIEMHESLTNLVARLASPTADGAKASRTEQTYPELFARAFGTAQITPDRVARALEQFLLVQVSCNSKFDRVMAGQERFTDEEARGFELFNTEYDPGHGQHGADCFHCHGGALFQSQTFANNGLDSQFEDIGRSAVTKRSGDVGKFAVPSLRNVAVTGPYMHDGRFKTLAEVVQHYCDGVKRSPTLDPNVAKHPDGGVPLSASDRKALVAFLNTLTDSRFGRTRQPTEFPSQRSAQPGRVCLPF